MPIFSLKKKKSYIYKYISISFRSADSESWLITRAILAVHGSSLAPRTWAFPFKEEKQTNESLGRVICPKTELRVGTKVKPNS